MKKRIFSLLLVFTMCFGSALPVLASDETADFDVEIISIADAEEIALWYLDGQVAFSEDTGWTDETQIVNRRAIFDENGIAQYYFELGDADGNQQGYIITGANTAQFPIIEFSDEADSFINQAYYYISGDDSGADMMSKVYYARDMNYILSIDDVFYDISTVNIQEVDSIVSTGEKKDYRNAWSMFTYYSGSSNPPDSKGDDFITNPGNYESGYSDYREFTVDCGTRSYSVMDTFSEGKVCVPTAAVNLCKNWYYRDSDYAALRYNNSWDDTFWYFFEAMNTSLENGTSCEVVADAYRYYFYDVGLSCNAYLSYGTDNGRDVVTELDHN